MVLSAQEESLISVVRALPPDEAGKVLDWARQLADLAGGRTVQWSELLNLDQLVVEGFETKWLRSKALSLGRTPEINFASLRLVEECLLGAGFEEDHAKSVVAPLKEAHDLRSRVKGHASGRDGAAIRRQILKDHGTFKKHFHTLCQRCDESFRGIAEAFKKLS